MQAYPEYDTYSKLYKKYLQGTRTMDLVKAAGPLKGKTVIDLCCGGGRLSKELVKQEAYCIAVDSSKEMMQGFDLSWHEGQKIHASIEEFLNKNDFKLRASAVFCQQAVTYWLTKKTGKLLADMLEKGSVFVFNTFNKKPPEHPPLIKHYEIEGSFFTEISRLVPATIEDEFDVVEHIQMIQGSSMHTTCFNWLEREDFIEILSPWFSLVEELDGNTSIWVCIRK